MPVTRSQRGEETHQSSSTGGTTSRTTTDETTTPSTSTATTTETSEQSTVTHTEATTAKESTTSKTDINKKESKMTLVPVGTSRRASSSRTLSRRRELEAQEELARLEVERLKAAAAHAKLKMELLQLEEDVDSEVEETEDRTERIQEWVNQSSTEDKEKMKNEQAALGKEKECESSKSDINQLAEAIMKAVGNQRHGAAAPPSYMHELPYFDGNPGEWLAFRTVYEDTACLFTPTQNMARLRRALKGNAREAIKSLLYSDAPPAEIMEALKRRFGRPDSLVLAELEKLKHLQRITENPKDVCIFASHVNNSVATIKCLQKPQYLHSPEMVKTILEKLPAVLKYRWFDFAAEQPEDYDLTLVSKFLNREADRCGAFAPPETAFVRRQPLQRHATHFTNNEAPKSPRYQENKQYEKPSCPHCEGEHRLYECRKFQQASVEERWDIAKKSRLCFKCLHSRHRKENCKRPACKICKRLHHPLLHSEARPVEKKEEITEVSNNVTNAVKTCRAYLKMVPVELYGPKGSERVMALLDEGSTVSLLDSVVAERIGASGPKEMLSVETVGGKKIIKEDSMRLQLKIRGVHQHKKKIINGVRTIDDISLTPQRLERERINQCAHLMNIFEEVYYEEESPRLLIGQDNWNLIITRSIKKGRPNQPVASLTELGWVLHGCDGGWTKPVYFTSCAHMAPSKEEKIEDMIKEHFAIESLGVQPRLPSTDVEAKAIKILEETSKRLPDGRFEAGLLWKSQNEEMPDNKKSAEIRLKNIEKKLEKDEILKNEYEKQIQHLIESNYAEKAPAHKTPGRTWYLPHFAVTHPTKKKIRIVFDAAAKAGGKSLNDALLPGPDLLQSLFGVLLRFRQGPYAVVADIKEMFLQVKIRPEDRDSLRFLWREDKSAPPTEYRMTSVIFGAASSPSTAIYVKNKNAEDFKEQYPAAARAIERNHYMDDYLHSFFSETEAKKTANEVNEIHKKAKFELRGWTSNHPHILDNLTDELQKKEVQLADTEEKTLGLRWFTERDELGFRTSLRNTPEEVISCLRIPTKREVTSSVMSTFDPLGLVAPVLIQGKRLLQDIWRSGVGWDDEITQQENETWQRYMKNLQLLKELKIPRCITQNDNEGELHIFTDASETAYAAAVYWRAATEESYDIKLLAGKARVTPLKPVSIPRLELQAALLGSRLAKAVEEELDLRIKRRVFWTDSNTVLAWIKTDPRTFKPFVAHRLAEIEDLSKPQEWRWVPSAQNPADDATRSIPENFDAEHRWFTGPDFLRNHEDSWPATRTPKAKVTGEEKNASETTTAVQPRRYATPDPARFSSWMKLWRATARVLQFIDLCKKSHRVNALRKDKDPTWRRNKSMKKKQEKKKYENEYKQNNFIPIGPSYLEKAEKILIKRCQQESFSSNAYKDQKLKKLDINYDIEGVLRLQGRIDAIRGVNEEYKKPAILDGRHPISKLLIAYYHTKFNHGNHATVMNEIRQKYWILGLRSAVRAEVHRCQWCRIRRSTPASTPMGDLPAERLRYGEHPFTCTGVDYFGPMIVTVGRRHEKRWGALFTCLTTRAVHVELADTLNTDSMIMALRRMASRRGMPSVVYSDNGTNFVGANRELKEACEKLRKEEFVTAAERMGVQWKFIPPGAPNMGGAWERLVRSIKTALYATLHEKYPREEVLHTLLLEAEHIVNSRPLTDFQENDEEEALTPNHFLIGRSCGTPRIGVFDDHELIGKATWRTSQRLVDHFWKRWLKEYLPTLLPRPMNDAANQRNLRCGDVVLIVDSNLPRCTWPRGEVAAVHPGPDGRTRVVDVRTAGGVLRRPCSKVVLLVPAEDPVAEAGVGAAHEGENVGDKT